MIEPHKPAEDTGEETALIPKSFLMGGDVEPGDTIKLKVVRIYGDEVEVAYAQAEEPEEESEMMGPEREIDMLAAQNAAAREGMPYD